MKASLIVQGAIGVIVIVVCIVSLLRDLRLSPHDTVRPTGVRRSEYMERWQAEAIYGVCMILGAVILAGAIQKRGGQRFSPITRR
jgi:phosphate/sulfate permease